MICHSTRESQASSPEWIVIKGVSAVSFVGQILTSESGGDSTLLVMLLLLPLAMISVGTQDNRVVEP